MPPGIYNGRIQYHPRLVIRAYKLAKAGTPRSRMAEALGTDKRTFKKWLRRHPELKESIREGYDTDPEKPFGSGKNTFNDHCLSHLPKDLVPLWNELTDQDGKDDVRKYADIMEGQAEEVKKQIFFYSLINSNFNKTLARRRACVNQSLMKKWMDDPDFVDLINSVHEMKKDFVEGCLMNLIAGGDTSATIFAAKTLLRDRGYGQTLTIESKGGTNSKSVVLHKVLHKLDAKSKRKVLQQLRAARETKALPPRVVRAEEVK